jgi:hypothetical protein
VTTIPVHNIEGIVSDLEKGLAHYRKGGPRAHGLGAAFQLHVALNLLDAIVPEAAEKQLAPLRHLHRALIELNSGVVDDMLKPRKWPRKPPIPIREAFKRGKAALAMDFMMEANKLDGGRGDKEAAAREVGQRLKITPYRQIDGWREHAMENDPQRDPIAFHYRNLHEQLSVQFPGDPRAAAESLMKIPLLGAPDAKI